MTPRWRCHVWGVLSCALLALAGVTIASAQQPRDELARLSREVARLLNEGKNAEAVPIAQRALAIAEARYGKDHPEVGVALNNLAEAYRSVGRLAEAEPLYKRDLAITEKARGPNHADVASALHNLALLYAAQGRQAEAEPLARRALAIREKALGANHPQVANSLDNLAGLYDELGRYGEAEPLYKRALTIREAALGPDHPDVGTSLNNLAALYESEGRYDDAEPLYKRSIAILEKALGPDHPEVGAALNNLALLYKLLGRYAEAEPLYKRDLSINEKANGPDHPDVAGSLSNLGVLYLSQGRYAEAETLLKTALATRERVLGLEHPAVGASLNSLAGLYYAEDRDAEVEPLLVRALAIREKALGPNHPEVSNALNNLATFYVTMGRTAEAEPLLKRALAIAEGLRSPNHPIVGTPLNNLALLYAKQGRFAEAAPLAQRALDVREKGLGPQHADVAVSLKTLAVVDKGQGRYDEAEALYQRSIAVFQSALGPEHPEVSNALNDLAALFFERNDWAMAANYWRQSTELIIRRFRRGTESAGKVLSGGGSDAVRSAFQFENFVKATYRLAETDAGKAQEFGREMFPIAQWGQGSQAAASIAQMSVRQAQGDNELARLVRERQDLFAEWQQRDKLLIAVASKPPAARNTAAEQGQRARLAAIDARLAELDKILQARFPEYAALTASEPLGVVDAQALLGPDEALVFFLDAPGHTPTTDEAFVWVVSKTHARWSRLDVSGKVLADRVARLRCGLDADAWVYASCAELLGVSYGEEDRLAGKLPPFDLSTAYRLYRDLFGDVADLIEGKSLLVVPSGPLTALPLHVLVTAAPSAAVPQDLAGYADAAWLARRHAITVLPSVPALKALRRLAKASRAKSPFIGFGNPLLVGPTGNDRRAWARQSCASAPGPTRVAMRGNPRPFATFFRGGLASVEQVRALYPLPETADELCAVARSTGGGDGAVYLGDKDRESTLKALSSAGALGDARVVHFATHGLLTGETEIFTGSKAEPALVFTPPEKATEEDDGLLTASEVTQLKLDADWVVLSACNTAAGATDKANAEALSGLARAFFYAGARALLVSHWAVNSEATVTLITGTFAELKRGAGRAEALRRSMLALLAGPGAAAHPASWAPFVVVGEGTR